MKNNKLVHVGVFGQPQGLKGEIKINILTSNLEVFKLLNEYFLENEKIKINFKSIRKSGKKFICILDGCNDRNEALNYKGKNIYSSRNNFPKIEDEKYYVIDLLDCEVFNVNNNFLGKVIDIKNFGADDLIEIKSKNKNNFFIPMNNDNLVSVDVINKIIKVDPIKGMID